MTEMTNEQLLSLADLMVEQGSVFETPGYFSRLVELARIGASVMPRPIEEAMIAASPSASTGKNGVVERVAAAILEAGLWKGAWVQANETEMNDARHKARAALAAIGER